MLEHTLYVFVFFHGEEFILIGEEINFVPLYLGGALVCYSQNVPHLFVTPKAMYFGVLLF